MNALILLVCGIAVTLIVISTEFFYEGETCRITLRGRNLVKQLYEVETCRKSRKRDNL